MRTYALISCNLFRRVVEFDPSESRIISLIHCRIRGVRANTWFGRRSSPTILQWTKTVARFTHVWRLVDVFPRIRPREQQVQTCAPNHRHNYSGKVNGQNYVCQLVKILSYRDMNLFFLLNDRLGADKKSVFSTLKRSERDRQKLLGTVLKHLRQLASINYDKASQKTD